MLIKRTSLLYNLIKEAKGPLMGLFMLIIVALIFKLSVPLVLRYSINYFSLAHHHNISMHILMSYGIIWTFSYFALQLRDLGASLLLEKMCCQWNLRIYTHVLRLPMSFHLDKKLGSLFNILSRADQAFENIFNAFFLFLLPVALEIMCILSVCAWFYGLLYAIVIAIALVLYGFFSWFCFKNLRKIRAEYNDTCDKVSSLFFDSLTNIETIKYFGSDLRENRQSHTALKRKAKTGYRLQLIDAAFTFLQILIVGAILTLCMYLAGNAVIQGTINIGDYVLINGYVLQFVVPMQQLGLVLSQINQGISDFTDSLDILAVDNEIHDAPNAYDLQSDPLAVEFKHVYFQYNNEQKLLEDISFDLPAGTMTALVGQTGAGSSTIEKLLLRLYDVTGGTIRINGHDIRLLTKRSLQRCIGIVPQNTILFNRSLAYNIGYGTENVTQKEIEKASELVGLTSFINTLPNGYDTLVGERGLKMSAGEKQKVSIARVLIKRPLLYILDEATSTLDLQTEKLILENIHRFSRRTTILVITHRLASAIEADRILFFEKGRIIEWGTHNDLLTAGGSYAALWKQQGFVIQSDPVVYSSQGDFTKGSLHT